jgi:hypothetical protein
MRSSSKINLRASSTISLDIEGQSLEALPQRYYLQGWWWVGGSFLKFSFKVVNL